MTETITDMNNTVSAKVMAGRDADAAKDSAEPAGAGNAAQAESSAAAAASEGIAASLTLAKKFAKAISDKKGRDIVVLNISRQSSFADFFVNATAGNTRMLATIKDEVIDELEKLGGAAKGSEGTPETGWVLVDCGDVIVNIFLGEQRDKYQIEKIWSDAEIIDIGDIDSQE
ncbi:MAG: ribosome silencing factor [Clostridiales Family XIII bacterium]|jgi:ribosome-associated protein|nr:ribosome silencing factor [Clostridiales Family XIII bacterium]